VAEKTRQGAGHRVCVTGASGFIGTHIVRELLERGYRVRGTVRDPGDDEKCAHLRKIAEGKPGELELVAADLMERGSFHPAIAGCDLVVHSASSVRLRAKNPQRDIVDVAVDGTNNVLDAIVDSGGVRRLVLTSSIAAIQDESKPHGHRFTEEDWNESSTVEDAPYPLSKALAERAAWKRVESLEGDARFELVTINPTYVLGPLYARDHLRSSPVLVRDLLTGKFPLVPNFHFGIVDVRDVADAHAEALHRDDASGRHILDSGGLWVREMAAILRKSFPEHRVPRWPMPNFAMYFVAAFDKRLSWSFLRRNLGVEHRNDNRRSIERLGIQYRDVGDTIRDTARSFIDNRWL
jgi:dihydroflavonol-4-reductase